MSIFLKDKRSDLYENFESKSFLYGLSYLADIFGHINNVNRALQGPGVTIMDSAEKLKAFLLKLSLWKHRLQAGNYANFPMLEDLILKNETKKVCEIFISMKKEFCSHLDTLQTSFQGYFNLDSLKSEAWIRNPFLIDLNDINDKDLNKEEHIDVRASKLLKIEFNAKTLEEFWCFQQQFCQSLAKQAIRSMISFATTYLCKAGFLALVTMKTKHRNRMDVQHDMQVALSKTHPQFSDLV